MEVGGDVHLGPGSGQGPDLPDLQRIGRPPLHPTGETGEPQQREDGALATAVVGEGARMELALGGHHDRAAHATDGSPPQHGQAPRGEEAGKVDDVGADLVDGLAHPAAGVAVPGLVAHPDGRRARPRRWARRRSATGRGRRRRGRR